MSLAAGQETSPIILLEVIILIEIVIIQLYIYLIVEQLVQKLWTTNHTMHSGTTRAILQ
jgi:hypothetical protein